jgi:NAD(P)-dependent dehydrogenase (short-subunit alcohol dehydrogenase family)
VDIVGFELSGRRVVVTGGGRGIGLAISRRLAECGCALALCGRDGERLGEAARELAERYGASVYTEALDVTAPEALESFIASSALYMGGLDGLVVNAGGARGGDLAGSSPQDWQATWALNVGQAQRAIRAAAWDLGRCGHGSVVIVSSISGWKPAPGAQYGSAKAAQIYLAASLARELGARGIRVNALSPGSTRVPGRRWDRMSRQDPEAFARFMAEFPAGSLVEMEEIADVAAFLLSDASRGINGANIPVDKAQNAPGASGY